MPDIRIATADDWREYRDIRLRALAAAPDAYGSTYADESPHDEAWWRSRVVGAHSLLALHQGRVVGTAVGIPDRHEAGSCEIVAVWVELDIRRMGIGEALIRSQVTWATDSAAPAIALWVTEGNYAARNLYERCGFVATGERAPVRAHLWEQRMRRPLP